MQCLILAGGLGVRMKPATDTVAKTLIPVLGRPFADHQLTWLAGKGVRRVVYCIGHHGGQIRDFVGDGGRWGLEAAYVDEGDRLLGTAGAIRLAIDEGVADGGFLVLYGDSFLTIDVRALWEASGQGALPVLSVFKNEDRWDASNARFEGGFVTQFEKGRDDAEDIGMNYIDYGLSVMTRDVVEAHVPAGQPSDLADLCHRLAEAGDLRGFEASERFYEIGSPGGLQDLEAHLASLE